jgi:hypothetical protein
MRAVAPLARGVFKWNHRALMSEGAEALAQRLGSACSPSAQRRRLTSHPGAPTRPHWARTRPAPSSPETSDICP